MLEFLYDWPLLLSGSLMVLVVVALGLCALAIVRRHLLPRLSFGDEHGHFGGAMVHSMMVFYGLVAALISVNVWETHNDVSDVVSREASDIAALYRDAGTYPEPVRTQLEDAVRDYTRYVIDEAWPSQRSGVIPYGGVPRMDRIVKILSAFEPATEGQKLMHAEALGAFNRLTESRTARLDANEEHLPDVMWLVMLVGAVICLFGACFFKVDDARLHGLFVGLLATLIALILFMTFVWDHPYRGELGVSAEDYELVYDQLMKP